MTRSHRTLPEVKSRHTTFHSCSRPRVFGCSPPIKSPFCGGSDVPEFTAVVRNTWSPHTIGDDQPRPGISAFHTTFSEADQCSDRFVLVVMPRAPRSEERRVGKECRSRW